ncbi:ATP-dependent Clp protease adapter ClpS [Gloeobacter kilaueensis]|uniref:ATP-dependent Clp protease adapter protein ClpS n=1 Tax=Gloeobacter kilaueensis (strain ATCC BAA-2537 / CCAP 1431/1 / ULC 316 / JS1) TaxID=1183438 RepID=U5QEK8_GLOK1|nr:ATP-dependent Clp protease adapter ClpS [Gloeobacter kilaueensis]AGY57331.1 ATP-dependent Clp protease adaptor protein ClpS [Gloeobacter kilaueensis JS1]
MSTETLEKKIVQRKPMPLYKVLLHNDNHTPMDYVIEVLMKTIPKMQPTKARSVMLEAHNSGVAVVIVCALEHAEFYSESLGRHGLNSTYEPDG